MINNFKSTIHYLKAALIASALMTFCHAALANSNCSAQYAFGVAPRIVQSNLLNQTHEICYEAFSLMHSGITKSALWSAEHLTQSRLASAAGLKRKNAFHEESQLPAADRAELRDYAHSGFDRGHLSPSADQPTYSSQNESFSLANMIPQNSNNNQNLWEGIESATRTLARKSGELYVVTGPAYKGTTINRIAGRVLVPTHVYKAIYDPQSGRAAAYLTENVETDQYRVVSIAELATLTGIDPFPRLSQEARTNAMDLPTPTPHGNNSSRSNRNGDNYGKSRADRFTPTASQMIHAARTARRFFHQF